MQRRAAAVGVGVLVVAVCGLAFFSSSGKARSSSGKAPAELKECREMLLTRNEELKNCQLECGLLNTADSPQPEKPPPSGGSSEVFDPVKWKEEILSNLPPKVRREMAPNLDRYFGIVQKNFDELRRENRQIREDARETLRNQDRLLKRYDDATNQAAELEAKDQNLQLCQADKTMIEERNREQVERIQSLAEDIRRFETSNLKCGAPSYAGDGLRDAKKKELCSFLAEWRKGLEGLAGE